MKDINEFECVKTIKQNDMNTLNRSVNVVAGFLAALETVKYLTDSSNIKL